MSHVHHETGNPCWLPSAVPCCASEVSIRLRPSRCGWWRLCGANWGAVTQNELCRFCSDIQNLTSLDQKVLQSTTQSIEWAWSWCFSSFEISPLRVPGSVSRPELSWWNPTCRRSNKQIISNSASRILWCKMWYEVSQRSRTGFPKQDELAQIYTLADVDKELSALQDF